MSVEELKKYEANGDGCWNFTGNIHPTGYGYTRGHQYAHRFFYTMLVGPIPEGLVIDHLCMNKRCVNPAHLEPVTQGENVRRWQASREPATHCHNGHDLSIRGKGPNGRCRVCSAARRVRYVAKKKAEAAA